MSQYTTGEIAKLCGVTVRTIQYYDTRGILTPSDLTEGGRRLYSEDDVRRCRIICFLREIGLSIDTIGKLLMEDDPGSVIEILLSQQEKLLEDEIGERREKLAQLDGLRRGLKSVEHFSVESIGDIANTMKNKNKLHRFRWFMVLTGIPIAVLQWAGILLWALKGVWWVFVVWAVAAIPFAIFLSRYYYKKIDYICPQCHTVFKPSFKEFTFSTHTATTRKLTCTCCGHKGFCVETWAGDEA